MSRVDHGCAFGSRRRGSNAGRMIGGPSQAIGGEQRNSRVGNRRQRDERAAQPLHQSSRPAAKVALVVIRPSLWAAHPWPRLF